MTPTIQEQIFQVEHLARKTQHILRDTKERIGSRHVPPLVARMTKFGLGTGSALIFVITLYQFHESMPVLPLAVAFIGALICTGAHIFERSARRSGAQRDAMVALINDCKEVLQDLKALYVEMKREAELDGAEQQRQKLKIA